MRTSRIHIAIFIGILLGAGIAIAAVTFAPGEAGQISDGVTFGAPNGANITVYGDVNVTMEEMFPDSRTVEINTSEGNITFRSDNPVWGTVYAGSNMTGPYTNVTDITAGPYWLEVYPQNKQRVDVRGDLNSIAITNMSVDDGNSDFVISGPDGSTGTVKLYTMPANTQIVAVDANGNYLDHTTSDSNGNATWDIPLSTKTVSLQTIQDNAPTQDNASPQGLISDTPNELRVDVGDQDFPADEVQVDILLDGTQIHSENITSNSTVTTSNFGNLDLGDHTWTVNLLDAYGNTDSQQYDFSLPTNITLRNESNASQLITDKNITATFYGDNGEIIVQRTDTNEDGNISLRGLPDTGFVVTFEGQGWYDRRAYIGSIGQQQNIYLLNSSTYTLQNNTAISTTFVYEDRTGQFRQDATVLKVQRGVDPNNDDEYEWQTVAGDYWGAAGEFPFTGQYQERYRLIVKNTDTNETRTLGTHIPVVDGTKNIIIGQIIYEAENATGRVFDAGINMNTNNLQIYYNDPTNQSTDLNFTVYEQGNKSNVLYNDTFSGPLGEKIILVPLNDSQIETDWVVTVEGEHALDGRIYNQLLVGSAGLALPIDPGLLLGFVFVFITFVGSLYGPRVALMGSWAMILFAGLLMSLQIANIPIVAFIVAIGIAAGGTLYREAIPK